MNNKKSPLISILIPSYQYIDGICRNLIQLSIIDDFEVIIFDDSSNKEIENIVTAWKKESCITITYQHNTPALGAISNWNALLDKARGEYCLLMHHDEFPLSENFISNLITTLRNHPKTDIALLDCILINPKNAHNRRHLPTWLRTLVLTHFPKYLYRRNVIGPTATLVIRRSIFPKFDTRLHWLVDVDVYVQLFEKTKNVLVCPNLKIGSILGRADSITAFLGSSTVKIKQQELIYMRNKYFSGSIWLGSFNQETFINKLLSSFETICWYNLRAFTRLFSIAFPHQIPRNKVKIALNTKVKIGSKNDHF